MSNQRMWRFWLAEMLEAIGSIHIYTANMSREEFLNNKHTRDAVAMNIVVIGESSTHIPKDVTSRYEDVPWREIKDMRNLIAHDYPGVDWKQVWVTVETRLSDLEAQLIEIYKNEADE